MDLKRRCNNRRLALPPYFSGETMQPAVPFRCCCRHGRRSRPGPCPNRNPVVAFRWMVTLNDGSMTLPRSSTPAKGIQLVPTFKGEYDQSMAAAIAAFRAGNAPDILQVFEVGTATMMYSKGRHQAGRGCHERRRQFDPRRLLPGGGGLLHGPNGQMLSFPFNSSTTVFYYNKDAFKAAGLDPRRHPHLARSRSIAAKLKGQRQQSAPSPPSWRAGPSWKASRLAQRRLTPAKQRVWRSGCPRLEFNAPLHAPFREPGKHVQAGPVRLQGSCNAADATFGPECAMFVGSSACTRVSSAITPRPPSFPLLNRHCPTIPDVAGAPQNTIIGGASLWALAGNLPTITKGVRRSFSFLSDPKVQVGQPPAHRLPSHHHGGLRDDRKAGLQRQNPGTDVAVNQMIRKTTDKSRGIRLGNLVQIRTIIDEETEQIWAGKKPPGSVGRRL